MAHEEVYGFRDQSYSLWHRRASTARYIGLEKAQLLAMIDLDVSLYVEYDDKSKFPVALIETAIDQGKDWKPSTVIQHLAKMANLPAACVLYTLGDSPNPGCRSVPDIAMVRVRRLWPDPMPLGKFSRLKPSTWAEALLRMREKGAGEVLRLLEEDFFDEEV
jgi:hypothetical protein